MEVAFCIETLEDAVADAGWEARKSGRHPGEKVKNNPMQGRTARNVQMTSAIAGSFARTPARSCTWLCTLTKKMVQYQWAKPF